MRSPSFLVVVSALLAANLVSAETVTVKPKQSLQQAADRLRPGDTLRLAEGIYHQGFKLTRSATAGNSITLTSHATSTNSKETTYETSHGLLGPHSGDGGGWPLNNVIFLDGKT